MEGEKGKNWRNLKKGIVNRNRLVLIMKLMAVSIYNQALITYMCTPVSFHPHMQHSTKHLFKSTVEIILTIFHSRFVTVL